MLAASYTSFGSQTYCSPLDDDRTVVLSRSTSLPRWVARVGVSLPTIRGNSSWQL